MKRLQRNFLSQGRKSCLHIILVLNFAFIFKSNGQIVNYVSNGGFEDLNNCFPKLKDWSRIDTNKIAYPMFHTCLNNVPKASTGDFQYPRSGNGYVAGTYLCIGCPTFHNRNYYRNKLKGVLKSNSIYCLTLYVNIRNYSTYGSDGIGVYFGANELDTIKYGDIVITYLNPQIQNPTGNIITDTLNWLPFTGTFVATGTEKFLVIGNFKSDAATNIIKIATQVPDTFSDFLLDDVSLMETNLPANAGGDKFLIPGDSTYIGRARDVGIDDACIWYKLPMPGVPIATVAGLWVKPISTTTYVVRQEICGNVKWDTVVVYENPLGAQMITFLNEDLKMFPQPAADKLELKVTRNGLFEDFSKIRLYDNLGSLIREEEISFKENKTVIKTSDLLPGVYSFQLGNEKSESINKRFVVAR